MGPSTGAARFCEKMNVSTGRRLYGPYEWEHFNRPAKLYLFHNFLPNLTGRDIQNLKAEAAKIFAVQGASPLDERTVSAGIENPFDIDGTLIQAIRWKGANPVLGPDSRAEKYTSGKGMVTRRIKVTGPHELTATEGRSSDDFTPVGTMEEGSLLPELLTSFSLVPKSTDVTLGFGIFDDLTFGHKDEIAGFAIFGMERTCDIRVLSYLMKKAKETGKLPHDAKTAALQCGTLLGQANERLRFHRYAHPNNFAYDPHTGARIVDLESVVDMSDIPKENWPLVLFREVSEALNPLYNIMNFPAWRARAADIELNTIRLVPQFLWGYFRGDTTLDFVRKIEPYVKVEHSDAELGRIFGNVPAYRRGSRRDTSSMSLVEPYVRLIALPSAQLPGKLLIGDFIAETHERFPLFLNYYKALERKAAGFKE